MINKIHKIGIVTDNIEDAVDFYTQKLGLKVTERFSNEGDEDYVFLDAGGIILELMPQRTMGVAPGVHHISFKVDNLGIATQRLREQGVSITKEPIDVGGDTGISLSFFEGPNNLNLQLYSREERTT
ncbi:MAG: Lactoylglutathione lyase [Candidatus Moanabacter tarae]|uniref:Lactoylglutathione lyase n=1 Tax=Candidatus Moanibacter tarae TaxID=2200854 RepID=A0A2Z4ANF2_9BACT|nr:MAG: Lactoylglutathione lyase [Candidatus Moanabacter tarae]|tara:strand:+ start:44573 stop:44953 length:381 start_codon:yes stop_codon:yes gene_type:complete